MRYFKLEEFECLCGKCGLKSIDPEFLHILDKIRHDCGFSFIVNSGCRCNEHNKNIGGATNSPHRKLEDGLTHGADIKALTSSQRYKIVKYAIKHGITRIGIGKTFIHLDNADKLKNQIHFPEIIWLY
jgi:hypothetical protein